MTAAKRKQKRRNLIKENLPPTGSEDRFRRELFWWLHERAPLYPALDISLVLLALGQLQMCISSSVKNPTTGKKPTSVGSDGSTRRAALCSLKVSVSQCCLTFIGPAFKVPDYQFSMRGSVWRRALESDA